MAHEHAIAGQLRLSTGRGQESEGTARSGYPLTLPGGYLQHYGIQRKAQHEIMAGADTTTDPNLALQAAAAEPGAPLTAPIRRQVEVSTGANLSGVRIHTGPAASQAASAISARAYTTGQDIHFGADQYRPDTPDGDRLIAHELVHTIQQQAGGGSGLQQKMEVSQPGDPAEREADAIAERVVSGRSSVEAASQVQQTAGAVQRDVLDVVEQGVDLVRAGINVNPLNPIDSIFGAVIQSNIAMASPITVPAYYSRKLREYATASPLDGVFLLAGMVRLPMYYSGGWILDVQTGAEAMTLDQSVFVRGDLSIGTYVHEMVHVGQYVMGRTAFLVSYFGLSALTLAYRLARRQPLKVFDSSPHEGQAYAIEERFMAWLASNP